MFEDASFITGEVISINGGWPDETLAFAIKILFLCSHWSNVAGRRGRRYARSGAMQRASARYPPICSAQAHEDTFPAACLKAGFAAARTPSAGNTTSLKASSFRTGETLALLFSGGRRRIRPVVRRSWGWSQGEVAARMKGEFEAIRLLLLPLRRGGHGGDNDTRRENMAGMMEKIRDTFQKKSLPSKP